MVTTKRKKPARKETPARASNFRPKKTAQSGVIRADEVLTVDAFCARMVCNLRTVAEMRSRGLIVRQDGGKNLRIHGADYLEYVRQLPPAPAWGTKDAAASK